MKFTKNLIKKKVVVLASHMLYYTCRKEGKCLKKILNFNNGWCYPPLKSPNFGFPQNHKSPNSINEPI